MQEVKRDEMTKPFSQSLSTANLILSQMTFTVKELEQKVRIKKRISEHLAGNVGCCYSLLRVYIIL